MNPTHPAATIDTTLNPVAPRAAATRQMWRRGLHLFLALLLIGIVARGFWPSYYGPMVSGTSGTRSWVLHVHGAVFTGWMLLHLLQATLAIRGQIAAHRRVGAFGIGYGVLLFVVGLVVSIAAPVLHIRAGEWTLDRAAGFLILPLADMVLFAGFFGGAVLYRRKSEVHKRLILAATVSIAFAAVARMQITSLPLFFLVWASPVLIGAAYDLVVRRRIHSVYAISLAVMLVAFLRILLMQWEPWLKIGRALLAPFI